MTDALEPFELPPDALELIKAGTPQPRTLRRPTMVTPEADPQNTVVENEVLAPPAPVSRLPDPRLLSLSELDMDASRAVASITVRLPGDIPQRLLRVSMERKLRRIKPFTQQEIVSTALREWLERNATKP